MPIRLSCVGICSQGTNKTSSTAAARQRAAIVPVHVSIPVMNWALVKRAPDQDLLGPRACCMRPAPTRKRTVTFTSTAPSILLTRLVRIIIVLLCAGLASVGCPGNVAAAPGKAPAGAQLYFGLVYPQTPQISALRTHETGIGKNVSLILWYQSWIEQGQLQPFPTNDMEAVRLHGAIPVLAWHPESYPPPPQTREPDFSLTAITSGKWDDYIHYYAAAARRWGHPFFLRFASEMNGSWVPWSEWANGNSAGQFIAMWRHVHDIFKAEGATNVTWVWCPNVDRGDAIPMKGLYPGDAYVDWLGMDGYNFGSDLQVPWASFAQVFQGTYNQLLALTPSPKPILIGETGSIEAGGSKAQWITDALTTQLPARFPRVKALIWFDMMDGNIDLRIQTSPQSLAAFRAAIALSTYQSNIYSTLSQSPIPPPEQVVFPQPAASATPLATPFGQLPRQLPSIAMWLGSLWGPTGLLMALLLGFLSFLALGVVAERKKRR